MSENKGFWIEHVGEYVRIDTPKQSYFGKVKSTDFDTTVLRPSLIDERYAEGKKGNFHLEKEKPTLIDTKAIIGIHPTSRQHLDNVCEHYSKNRRIILP